MLKERPGRLRIDRDEFARHLSFGPTTYQRNLIHQGPAYQALALCWRSGQRSPIHDHRNSGCAVRVLEGVATETIFNRTGEGYVYAMESRTLAGDGICASFDSDIHQISNLQPAGQDLITLHIYSPALLVMGTYSLTETKRNEFRDPVFAMADGDGT